LDKGVRLLEIKVDHEAAVEGNPSFLFTLERALLLSLREQGKLTEAQCQRAEEKLRRSYASKRQENVP